MSEWATYAISGVCHVLEMCVGVKVEVEVKGMIDVL